MKAQNVSLEGKTILVTGGAGFIGARLSQLLLERIHPVRVVVLDELNDYYDPRLKHWRLEQLRHTADRYAAQGSRFAFVRGSIADEHLVRRVFADYAPAVVVNLAAQAGVRYSIDHPDAYIESNLVGFFRILEACRHSLDGGGPGVEHLVYASSSSVYGSNTKLPYSTEDKTDSPISLYAATKKSDELLACAYAGLYRIPATGLRFFTVYGPAGRPDMAYFKFTDCLRRGERIPPPTCGQPAVPVRMWTSSSMETVCSSSWAPAKTIPCPGFGTAHGTATATMSGGCMWTAASQIWTAGSPIPAGT